ncbi:MAG TPA: universal stress protein, partial [Beutenbergiaceae bacterium]|nr:universal stress protein [Beutenbergiaceae bacterium]
MEPKHIIVGYDGSPESKAAIAWAAGVAQRRRRTLVVATATGTDSDDAQRASSLAQQGAELAQQEADINVHELSPETGVVKALVELSREAELLVMGHRG